MPGSWFIILICNPSLKWTLFVKSLVIKRQSNLTKSHGVSFLSCISCTTQTSFNQHWRKRVNKWNQSCMKCLYSQSKFIQKMLIATLNWVCRMNTAISIDSFKLINKIFCEYSSTESVRRTMFDTNYNLHVYVFRYQAAFGIKVFILKGARRKSYYSSIVTWISFRLAKTER